MKVLSEICWSWTHGTEPIKTQEGHYVCEACMDEEARILKTHEQLQSIENEIKLYLKDSRLQRQHPSQAQVLEDVISGFFVPDLPALKTGKAFRINLSGKTQSELDIIIDFDSSEWLGRSRRQIMASPPLAHMEVCFRSQFDVRKIKDDLRKIHDTVLAGAALVPPQKVWSAFIGLGEGWSKKREDIIKTVHGYFHDVPPRRIQFDEKDAFWDYPDILFFPGFMLKKSDCCSEPGLIDHWPVYIEIPSALNDPVHQFRPLSIARGFFVHFIRSKIQGRLDTGEAWSDKDSSSIFGPNFRIEGSEQKLVSLTHAPKNLFIRDTRPEGHTVFLHFKCTGQQCTQGRGYHFIRERGSAFDGVGITIQHLLR